MSDHGFQFVLEFDVDFDFVFVLADDVLERGVFLDADFAAVEHISV